MTTQIHVEPADHNTDLCAILGRYGSDKGNATHTARHDFSRYYAALFRPIREQVRRVFELGVFQGASLRAWQEYFPQAQIVGMDIDPGLCNAVHEPRITTYCCDELDVAGVKAVWAKCEPFDIFIDDGLHTYADNTMFFAQSWEMVKPGGLYIIEDLRAEEVLKYRSWAVDSRASGWGAHVVDMPREGVPDNALMIMRRP